MVTPFRLALVALLLVAATLGVAAASRLVEEQPSPGPLPSPSAGAAPPGPVAHALDVLHNWDERRSRAWAAGDAAALRRLYTPASAAGRHDRAMLRRWLGRGLVVRGLRTQVLAVELLSRAPGRLVLRVTDRVSRARAVGAGGRSPLPRDRASTRAIVLRRLAGEWRVASVRPAEGGPARPVSRTGPVPRPRRR